MEWAVCMKGAPTKPPNRADETPEFAVFREVSSVSSALCTENDGSVMRRGSSAHGGGFVGAHQFRSFDISDPILYRSLFAGKRLSQVPRSYLELLHRDPNLHPFLGGAVAAELWRRRDLQMPPYRAPGRMTIDQAAEALSLDAEAVAVGGATDPAGRQSAVEPADYQTRTTP
jgi:hypothetical protein